MNSPSLPSTANSSSQGTGPGTGKAPGLTVVIVNYESWPDVSRLVATLVATTEVAAGRAEVVLVDNNSRGPVPEELLAPAPGYRLVARPDNDGFAAGVNSGWHAARGRWLLVLNPDVVVDGPWLGEVVARVERFESEPASAPGIVGFGLRNPDGSRQPSVGAFPSLPRTLWEQLIPRPRRKYQAEWKTRPGPVPWVTGACMLIDTRLLAVLGGMDEDFFLYYEEVALCRAACRHGRRVDFDPSVAVTHLRPLQNRTLSPKMRVITRHSKLLYFRKHLPPWHFIGLSWIISLEATILGQWSKVTKQTEDARAWRTIRDVSRAFRAGSVMRGREVRTLAELVAEPATPAMGPARIGIGSAWRRRGVRRTASPLKSRKDGPACH